MNKNYYSVAVYDKLTGIKVEENLDLKVVEVVNEIYQLLLPFYKDITYKLSDRMPELTNMAYGNYDFKIEVCIQNWKQIP